MEELERPVAIRQSLIAAFDSCNRRALFSLLDKRRSPSTFAAVGILFHRWVRLAIELMRQNGENRLAVEIGLELLVSVMAQEGIAPEDIVPIRMQDMRWLRVLVVKWCNSHELNVKRIVDVERRLFADITLPDGTVRQVTGQLDVLMADPPVGAIVLDHKTGWARPKNTREETPEEEGKGLTELGWVQSLVYAILVFANYQSVQQVTFREWHVRWGESRQTVIQRWEAERMQDVLAAQVYLLDKAIEEGPDSPRWTESAGPHCSLCAMPKECPIQRQVGIPTSSEEARRLAQEWIVAGEVRKERLPYIKGWCEVNGSVEVPHSRGRRLVGWSPDKKTFGIYEPRADESPFDAMLEGILHES